MASDHCLQTANWELQRWQQKEERQVSSCCTQQIPAKYRGKKKTQRKWQCTGTGCLGSSLEIHKNFKYSRLCALKLPLFWSKARLDGLQPPYIIQIILGIQKVILQLHHLHERNGIRYASLKFFNYINIFCGTVPALIHAPEPTRLYTEMAR